MSFALAEHDRMLAGVVKDCYVVALDLTASPPVCRVSDGEWVSAWVRWHSVAAGKARHWRAPTLGEQGTLFSASGDVSQGTFIPGLYGNAGAQPDNRDHVEVWRFDDGGSLIYDWQANTYTIDLPSGTVTVTVGASSAVVTDDSITAISETITAKAATITLDGNVTISGTLAVVGDIHGGGQIIDTGGNTPNHKH
ncbi:Baseplate assembly protein V [Pseudomonas caricapapayae]|uniref:Baseplate assembly protein V n=1 Tax=Pseudomonas caricapapayae TaxID=46678 RepID=A0A0P9KS80_9PSED|nr:phage baseplate assembly protein V [Pseudomonas caricapapayae]KAA8693655.1 phage baseplate assembly protein V [Pseudomonas caricapapayae]KPW59162.1 Baseplate assembly protein V [Pseudomonas caricapapayae]RMM06255.1 Baseplate assembly protein V [Pseudomonas caricapapayae]